MKKQHMYFCRLLALLLLFPALAACRQTAAPSEGGSGEISGTGEEGTQAGPGEDNTPTLVLAANGESDYTFWLSRELYATSPEIKDELADIAKLIRERTGADIPIRSDSSAEEADFAEPGILIGNTVFPESAEVDLVMKNQDFYVGMSGNKVLLCGATKTGVYNAVRYFYNNVVLKQRPDGSQPLVFSQEHVYRSGKTYPINSVLCCGTELMQYRMVIPKDADVNERMLAYNLRYHLSQQYGQDFEMVTDDAPEADFEILIGRTNRTTADAQGSGYTVAAEDGKLQLLAGNMRGYEALDAYVRQELLRAGSGADYVLADGFVHNGSPANSLDDGTLLSEERSGDLRVMFYNVYGYNNSGPVSLRQELQLELFRLYQPDVLGMQEYSPAYHSSFTSMLNGIGYQQVAVSAGTSNYTPLFYRADRLEVVESGYLRYAGPNDGNSKSVTWAVFRVRESGERFIAMSTHFMWNQPGIDANSARISNAQELLELIGGLRARYSGVPLIFGGDLNCRSGSDPMRMLLNGGMLNARDEAERKNDSNGYHSYSTYDTANQVYTQIPAVTGNYSTAIDHALVTPGTSVRVFTSLISPYTLYSSDHMPVLVELALG